MEFYILYSLIVMATAGAAAGILEALEERKAVKTLSVDNVQNGE